MTRSIHLSPICLSVMLSAFSPAREAPEPIGLPAIDVDIEGVYEASGQMGDVKYSGVLATVRRRGAGYRVQWNVEGTAPTLGMGMRRGSELIVGFHPYAKNGPHVGRYVIEAGGPKLVGLLVMPDGTTGTETMVWLKK